MQKQTTTKNELESPRDASLISGSDGESLNPTSLQTADNSENSKLVFHLGSECNRKSARMSGRVFVLSKDGKPLTPCKESKARKLLEGNIAKSVWNKFRLFGIQMLVETRKETPKTALGVDFGTKFEGYAVVVGYENVLAVMWKLPDKQNLVKKLEERRRMRRARRWRNCRRREARFDNRGRGGFIAPSQLVMVQSRLKCLNEFFKCYPIDFVALEDVKFNHRDNRWGKNFSTVEIGKQKIYSWIRARALLTLIGGYDTQTARESYGYKKSSNKSAEIFNSHCSDALAMAVDVYARKHISEGNLIIVDDTYRFVRRQLHDTQFSKGGIRDKYSTGNFKGVKKGTICELGQICGGTGNQLRILPFEELDGQEKRISKSINKIRWISHKFKTKLGNAIPLPNKLGSPLAN